VLNPCPAVAFLTPKNKLSYLEDKLILAVKVVLVAALAVVKKNP